MKREMTVGVLVIAILILIFVAFVMFAISHPPGSDRRERVCTLLAQQYPQLHVKSTDEFDFQINADCLITDDLSHPWIPVAVSVDHKTGKAMMVRR